VAIVEVVNDATGETGFWHEESQQFVEPETPQAAQPTGGSPSLSQLVTGRYTAPKPVDLFTLLTRGPQRVPEAPRTGAEGIAPPTTGFELESQLTPAEQAQQATTGRGLLATAGGLVGGMAAPAALGFTAAARGIAPLLALAGGTGAGQAAGQAVGEAATGLEEVAGGRVAREAAMGAAGGLAGGLLGKGIGAAVTGGKRALGSIYERTVAAAQVAQEFQERLFAGAMARFKSGLSPTPHDAVDILVGGVGPAYRSLKAPAEKAINIARGPVEDGVVDLKAARGHVQDLIDDFTKRGFGPEDVPNPAREILEIGKRKVVEEVPLGIEGAGGQAITQATERTVQAPVLFHQLQDLEKGLRDHIIPMGANPEKFRYMKQAIVRLRQQIKEDLLIQADKIAPGTGVKQELEAAYNQWGREVSRNHKWIASFRGTVTKKEALSRLVKAGEPERLELFQHYPEEAKAALRVEWLEDALSQVQGAPNVLAAGRVNFPQFARNFTQLRPEVQKAFFGEQGAEVLNQMASLIHPTRTAKLFKLPGEAGNVEKLAELARQLGGLGAGLPALGGVLGYREGYKRGGVPGAAAGAVAGAVPARVLARVLTNPQVGEWLLRGGAMDAGSRQTLQAILAQVVQPALGALAGPAGLLPLSP